MTGDWQFQVIRDGHTIYANRRFGSADDAYAAYRESPRVAEPMTLTLRPYVWSENKEANTVDGLPIITAKFYDGSANRSGLFVLRHAPLHQAGTVNGDRSLGGMLPYRCGELPIPFIVRAVLGVGHIVLVFDRATMKPKDRGVEYCAELKKVRGKEVKTDLFVNDEYSHVSAVRYRPSCWVDHPTTPGSEFVVVHNTRATNPLPDG